MQPATTPGSKARGTAPVTLFSMSALTKVYLDYNASAPLCAEAADAMHPWLAGSACNPSSAHRAGQRSRAAVEQARGQVAELIAMVNERLIIGHFDLWIDDGLVVYRHSLLLRGISQASVEQLEDLVDISLNECERFYPAFQFVVWGGKKPAEAVEAAILETRGEA